MERLRDSAPVAFTFLAAWAASTIYLIAVLALAGYAQGGRFGPAGAGLSQLGQVWTGYFMTSAVWGLTIVLFIAAVYVPLAIFIANLFERRAGFAVVIREEFASTAACALAALAVSLLLALPAVAIISWQGAHLASDALLGYFALLPLIPLLFFAALMAVALRAIFRINRLAAALSSALAFIALPGLPLLVQALSFVCASPFLLLLLIFLLRDRIQDLLGTQRRRQSFKQSLVTATLNPADASAHYNLGLLYQQRGDAESAIEAFRRAVEIDPQEADAHYQLGRIAREAGRLPEAIGHFETVVRLSPAHSQHEIWREIARAYLGAGQHADALEMLDRFLQARPSDAEGRYWRGVVLDRLGRRPEARREMEACVETVRTAPAYKYRQERGWMKLAQQFLRERRT
jgi:tetratricopeptide (TPR) repeat protein